MECLEYLEMASETLSTLPMDIYISDILAVVQSNHSRPKTSLVFDVVNCFGPAANPDALYLQMAFEKISYTQMWPDIATCLCWLCPEDGLLDSSTTSTENIVLMVGGEDYCVTVFSIPVALLHLSSATGMLCFCRPVDRFYTHIQNIYLSQSFYRMPADPVSGLEQASGIAEPYRA